jgi:hypothetical protein
MWMPDGSLSPVNVNADADAADNDSAHECI